MRPARAARRAPLRRRPRRHRPVGWGGIIQRSFGVGRVFCDITPAALPSYWKGEGGPASTLPGRELPSAAYWESESNSTGRGRPRLARFRLLPARSPITGLPIAGKAPARRAVRQPDAGRKEPVDAASGWARGVRQAARPCVGAESGSGKPGASRGAPWCHAARKSGRAAPSCRHAGKRATRTATSTDGAGWPDPENTPA